MSIKRLIFLVNLYTFCIGTIFILPVMVPYYKDALGLTFRDLMVGEAVFAAVIIAMEIPSGWLSDVWSRKYTLMVGCFTALLGFSLLITANGFWMAILAQGILGIGVACNSGTVTSILYDALKSNGQEHLYQKLEGKRHAIGLYAVATGAIGGGILYSYNIYYPLMMDVATLVLALICTFFIVEPMREKRAANHSPFKDMVETVKYALHGHKEIAGIIIVSTVLFCTTKMFMWAQQPYMLSVGIPVDYFGYIMAAGFIFGGLAGHIGHSWSYELSNRRALAMLTVVPIVAALGAIIFYTPIMILCLLSVAGVWGFGFPFVQNAINKHADPARRATILSTLGLLISLMFIPASLMMGFLEETYSIRWSLGYLALQLGGATLLGFYLWSRGSMKKAA